MKVWKVSLDAGDPNDVNAKGLPVPGFESEYPTLALVGRFHIVVVAEDLAHVRQLLAVYAATNPKIKPDWIDSPRISIRTFDLSTAAIIAYAQE